MVYDRPLHRNTDTAWKVRRVMSEDPIAMIADLIDGKGERRYGLSSVNQRAHALQAAANGQGYVIVGHQNIRQPDGSKVTVAAAWYSILLSESCWSLQRRISRSMGSSSINRIRRAVGAINLKVTS